MYQALYRGYIRRLFQRLIRDCYTHIAHACPVDFTTKVSKEVGRRHPPRTWASVSTTRVRLPYPWALLTSLLSLRTIIVSLIRIRFLMDVDGYADATCKPPSPSFASAPVQGHLI